MAYHLSLESKKRIFHLLCEGNGIRSIERVVGAGRETISKLQSRFQGIVNHLSDLYIKDLDIEEIEADEIRTFVGNKTNLRWIYIALDKKSRLVIHFHVGKRDTKDARKFLIGLSEKLNSSSKVSTDCLKSYVSAIANNPTNAETLSQTESINLLRSKQIGRKLGRAITNKIEAHNGNVRQHISRLVRRTRCFSKKDSALVEHLSLFFFYYNFIKKHKVLKETPAMSAGLVDKPISLDDLMEYDAIVTGQVIKKPSMPDMAIESAIGDKTLMEYEEIIEKLEKENKRLIISRPVQIIYKETNMAELGRKGGLKGGKARAEKLSPERRREIAQIAAAARWGTKIVGAL